MSIGAIRLVLTDIDGVWTDGGMYYDQSGNEFKRFDTADSAGVLYCHLHGVQVGIITGEDTHIVKRRAEKLSVDHLFMGIQDKLEVAQRLGRDLAYSLDEVAYIGDAVTDIPLLREVGYSGTVSSAPDYVKREVDIVTTAAGGQGAFREFVETLLATHDLLEPTLERCIAEACGESAPTTEG